MEVSYKNHNLSNQYTRCIPLPEDGRWGEWGPFGRCSTGCQKTRERVCNNPPPSGNGAARCSGGDGLKQVQSGNCNPWFCGKLPILIELI